ncbi:hypothetical protein [Spiroplasma sp. SV19]|uniref:hypothetical protein n=1 Tax=Spiroplasma sp. SV19 TaxID=2570468 RepID=UPI0024B83485|nr:hypothetical protein [Spiroplasma sp. SV19]WHQ36556.1 hypothetical protein E7Y35_01240 [Spiroplasma sp. SV19]
MKPNQEYSLLESSLPHGGIKVKLNGNTAAQFPTLEKAVGYLKVVLGSNVEVNFVDKNGMTKVILT